VLAQDANTGFWNILWSGSPPVHWQEWKCCDYLPNWTQQGQIAPSALPVPNSAVLAGNELWWEVKFVGVDGTGNPVTPFTNVASSPLDTAEIHNELAGLKALIDAQQSTIQALQAQISDLQSQLALKVSLADVNQAIASGSACNVDGIDEATGSISDPPQQPEVQALQDCVNNLIGRLQH
jgi:hypothetical protein